MEISNWTGKIHNGDCVDLLRKIPENSISTIVTSPPYNIRNSTGAGVSGMNNSFKWPNAAIINGYDGYEDNIPHEDYVKWQRDCLFEMMRVLKEDGVIFYNHKWRVQNGLLQDRNDIVNGFPVRQIIIWQRAGGINFNPGYFLPTYEVIYMICKPKFKLAENANIKGDIWKIPQTLKNEHPAPFPLELAMRCVESTIGGIVLDPFMGSGTTAIAAISQNREWIGIELSEKYCKMAEGRIKKYKSELTTQLF